MKLREEAQDDNQICRSMPLAAADRPAASWPAAAQAQSWPQKPIMFVVPFAPGGGTDAFARPLAAQLDSQLGQRVLIENKAGAGGTLGASYAIKQAADGYTFLIGAAHHTIAPSIYPKLDYDIEKDFVPVIMLAQPPHVVSVNPEKIQAKTLEGVHRLHPEATRSTTARPAPAPRIILPASSSTRWPRPSSTMCPTVARVPLMQDLLAGHVPVAFDGLGTSAPQIAGGRCAGLRSPHRSACRRCRTCRHRPKQACRVSSSRPGTASSRRRARRRRRSTA